MTRTGSVRLNVSQMFINSFVCSRVGVCPWLQTKQQETLKFINDWRLKHIFIIWQFAKNPGVLCITTQEITWKFLFYQQIVNQIWQAQGVQLKMKLLIFAKQLIPNGRVANSWINCQWQLSLKQFRRRTPSQHASLMNDLCSSLNDSSLLVETHPERAWVCPGVRYPEFPIIWVIIGLCPNCHLTLIKIP